MNKEEQIKETNFHLGHLPWLANVPLEQITMLAEYLYDHGYRKVTKPKVLSDEEIEAIPFPKPDSYYYEGVLGAGLKHRRLTAQAQLDAAWKEIWGEE